MSYTTLGQQGLEAAEARNWDVAISKLTTALNSSENPAWLIARSKALISKSRFQEALADANLAWHKAWERNKRPLLIEAQHRRAVAYYRLGQYANADFCCVYAMRLAKGNPAAEKEDWAKQFVDGAGRWTVTLEDAKKEVAEDPMSKSDRDASGALTAVEKQASGVKEWRQSSAFRVQALSAMERLAEDDPGRKLTTQAKPEKAKLSDLGIREKNAAVTTPKPAAAPVTARPPVPADTPLRIQEFQSNTSMSVSIFSKGVNKENLKIEFTPFSVRLNPVIYPSGDEKEYCLSVWAEINPEACKYTVTPSKIELNLAKKAPGKWKQLSADPKKAKPNAAEVEEKKQLEAMKEARKKAEEAHKAAPPETSPSSTAQKDDTPQPSGPSYPTSSASGPKNWDKITADENSDDEDGKDVNFFFKKLYKDATPEQQRAMMKSFTESNGTSLSTDWSDVKDRTVETVPPAGVEAKKWKE